MSWSNQRIAILALLTAYKEVPDNKTIEESAQTYKKNAFTLKYTGSGSSTQYVSNGIAFTNVCELKIIFENNLASERNINADTFINLQKSIAALSGFKGFNDERSFEDFDDKHTIGKMNFEIGIEGSC
jgi:hypothetical protein